MSAAGTGAPLRTVEPLPAPVLAFVARLAGEPDVGSLTWCGAANSRLAELGRVDPAAACMAWRAASNLMRLHTFDASAEPAGGLVVTAFHARRTTMSTTARSVSVLGRRLVVTGVRFADCAIVKGRVDRDEAATVVLMPADAISVVARPELRGLQAADNALVDIEGTVQMTSILGGRGWGREVTEAPYRAGLSFGAVAVGALRRLEDELAGGRVGGDRVERVALLSEVSVQARAASELLARCTESRDGAERSWLSRAVKVHAVGSASRLAARAVAATGAAAYGVDHILARLAADVEGLGFQAPSDESCRRWLAAPDVSGSAWSH